MNIPFNISDYLHLLSTQTRVLNAVQCFVFCGKSVRTITSRKHNFSFYAFSTGRNTTFPNPRVTLYPHSHSHRPFTFAIQGRVTTFNAITRAFRSLQYRRCFLQSNSNIVTNASGSLGFNYAEPSRNDLNIFCLWLTWEYIHSLKE